MRKFIAFIIDIYREKTDNDLKFNKGVTMPYEKINKDNRITLDMEDSLYEELISYRAANNNMPYAKIIRTALREFLARSKKKPAQKEGV